MTVFSVGLRVVASHLDHNLAVLSEMETLGEKKNKKTMLISLRRTRENSSVVAVGCLGLEADVCVSLQWAVQQRPLVTLWRTAPAEAV